MFSFKKLKGWNNRRQLHIKKKSIHKAIGTDPNFIFSLHLRSTFRTSSAGTDKK